MDQTRLKETIEPRGTSKIPNLFELFGGNVSGLRVDDDRADIIATLGPCVGDDEEGALPNRGPYCEK
jgi:hypothetical protein